MTQTVKQCRVKVGNSYSASGYGRGINRRNVYLIDGYYYAYHPEYAKQAFYELTGELAGYVPCNAIYHDGQPTAYYQCNPTREGYKCHIPARAE